MKLYNELAHWWQLMSPAVEYREEAAFYRTTLNNAASRPIETLLELGSGGGNNASHMKLHYQGDGPHRQSPDMLAIEPRRGMRWLEWRWDPDPGDSTYLVDYAFMMRERGGSVHVEHDRHLEGLFPRATWLRLFKDVGFTHKVLPIELSDLEPGKHEVFVCQKR